MRATDFIRNVLDLVDQIDDSEDIEPVEEPCEIPSEASGGESRFKQIFDILSAERNQMYSNSPNEVVAGIESVTTDAGGGLNGPKNPADIRADSVAMYPNHLHKPGA